MVMFALIVFWLACAIVGYLILRRAPGHVDPVRAPDVHCLVRSVWATAAHRDRRRGPLLRRQGVALGAAGGEVVTFTLPYPPSVNHYWRHFRGRTVISGEGRTFRTNVCALLAGAGGNGVRKPPSGGRIALAMDAFPPDRPRRDLDNLQKATLDALEHAGVYEDDSQVDLLLTRRRALATPPRVEVHLAELPTNTCLLCGRPFRPENN